VRVLCNINDVQNASQLALKTNDPQACFHLARHYEQDGNMGEAILYYSKSQRLHHAIRLAKEHGFDQQVMTMSLQASPQIMIQSAIYFEKKGKLDKSVQLYSRGGNKRRAMEIAMRHNLSHMIEDISAGVGDGDDPEVMKNSVDYLMQNGQYDKAVEIMISLGNMEDALGVAEMRNVEVKEELVMKLIPKAEATAHSKQ
jgi:intraflagellar transport protein 140